MSELVVRAGQQPTAYGEAARYTLASQTHQGVLAPSLHLTKRKDIKIKPTGPPLGVHVVMLSDNQST